MQGERVRTEEQARDERARFLAGCLGDFERFCGLLNVPLKSGGRAPWRFSPIQRKFNRERTGWDIVLKPRQIFFTTLECARDLFVFLTRPGAHVVVMVQSQAEQQALKDVWDKFRVFTESLQAAGLDLDMKSGTYQLSIPRKDAWLRVMVAGASPTAADNKGRAGTVTRLHASELAFWQYPTATLNAMGEAIVSREAGGEVVIESTANGAGGEFHSRWQRAVSGDSNYKPHFFEWWLHPEYRLPTLPGEVVDVSGAAEDFKTVVEGLRKKGTVSEGHIKWLLRKLRDKENNLALVRQEYPFDAQTCFLVSGRGFFDADFVHKAIAFARKPIREELKGALRVWKDPEPGKSYAIGVDPSEGILDENVKEESQRTDACAVIVRERFTAEHVATLHGRWIPWDLATYVNALGRRYNFATVAVERNNHGHSVLQALVQTHKYPRLYQHMDGRYGWHTTPVTRPPMLDAVDAAQRRGTWKSPDVKLLGEQHTFVMGKDGVPRAASGSHDDLVLADAICWAAITRRERDRDAGNLPPA